MSYIRSLSNPEHFYIWSDGNFVHWWSMGEPDVERGKEFLIPQKVFDGTLRKYANGLGMPGPFKYKGALLEEIHSSKAWEKWAKSGKGKEPKDPDAFKWRFTYKGLSKVMWEVTLDRIADRFLCEACEERRKKHA